MVEIWKRRDVIKKDSMDELGSHPSFLRHMVGYNSHGNSVVKVFYWKEKSSANFESYFKNCCDNPEDLVFEFKPVEKKCRKKTDKTPQENLKENKGLSMDTSTMFSLGKAIEENKEQIYAKHSSVIAIGIGEETLDKADKKSPCVVLYCLDKAFRPFGEDALPQYINGWQCHVKEDFVMFGHCPTGCPALHGNLPVTGCSISISKKRSSGSVGFLVEYIDESLQYGFLTASHVAVPNFADYFCNDIQLSCCNQPGFQTKIVHPSLEDSEHEFEVGKVVKSFFGNMDSNGLDVALVKSELERQEGKNMFLHFNNPITSQKGF